MSAVLFFYVYTESRFDLKLLTVHRFWLIAQSLILICFLLYFSSSYMRFFSYLCYVYITLIILIYN